MLDINFIRKNPDEVKNGLAKKNYASSLIDHFLEFDEKWRKLTKESEDLKARQKKMSQERLIEEAKNVKAGIQTLEDELKKIEAEREKILRLLPNLPLPETPVGKNEKDNVIIREEGEKPEFSAKNGFEPKDYLEISKNLDLIDIERASKVSGSRFGYLKNQAAILEFALIKFAFDVLIKNGFVPIIPPVMIKEEMMKGMGYVDIKEDKEERYFLEKDDLYFVGTAEQAIGPMHSGEIFKSDELPKRYAAFSTCFRREAGSYGKDTKGILRVHQFDKVEMFSFVRPEDSKNEHKLFLDIEESLMKALKLPYRVVQLCSGDLSRPSAATYDIETWMPGQNNGKGQYRETHSCSNTTDFQSRRLNVKYRKSSGETEFIHTINGTAFAVGRMLIAIIENYQQKDGSVLVPEVLRDYLGFDKIYK